MIPDTHTAAEFFWIALSIFMLGMSKGGFPVGPIALPLLILLWPDQTHAAKSAVAFMLPMLCAMDIVALAFYRKQIEWRPVLRLLPATLLGVAVASALFVSDRSAVIGVSDRVLKLLIGIIGLLFIAYQGGKKWILSHLESGKAPGWAKSSLFGFGAGVTSTLAHAAGPVIQMYLLPQHLAKLRFAGTTCVYFFILNLVKMAPFSLLGRIQRDNLVLGLHLLPVIPAGVAAGYGLVRLMKGHHYRWFIYTILLITSATLIVKAVGG